MNSPSDNLDRSLFFELTDPLAIEPYRLRSRLPAVAKTEGVDIFSLSQGKAQTQSPIQFDATQGREATDILWTQLVTPVCISGKVVRLLLDANVSGWSTYPVEVFDSEGELQPQYHGLAVTGVACEADYSRSTVVEKPSPAPRGSSYEVFRGVNFDEDQWDGSDMFWVGAIRVVVARVKELFERASIENVKFVSLTERETRVRHARRN